MMRLIQDKESARTEIAEQVPKTAAVGLIGHQRVRDDEARTRRPRIGGIATLASEGGEMFAIDQSEGETELCLKLVLPLPNHSGGSGDENEINASPQEHFAENQTGFDRLAGADIVGNQQVDPRNAQGLPQWKKLIGVLVDAGPERSLEQVSIGGGRGIPAEPRRYAENTVGSSVPSFATLAQPSSLRTEPSSSASHRPSTTSP